MRRYVRRESSNSNASLFNLVVEDGSHKQRDQQMLLGLLFPLVSPRGYYVIEDLQSSFQSGYDVPSRGAQTTAAVLKRWNETGRLSSSFLTAEQAAKIAREGPGLRQGGPKGSKMGLRRAPERRTSFESDWSIGIPNCCSSR